MAETFDVEIVSAAEPSGAGAPARTAKWSRTALWIHRWTGLVTAPFFLVLCLTGSVLIFHEEVDEWTGAVPHMSAPQGSRPQLLSALEKAAVAQKPGSRAVYTSLDPEHPARAAVGLGMPGQVKLEGARPVFVNVFSAEPAPLTDIDKNLTTILLKLHAQWFAGVPGELFGSLLAMLIFLCIVSGVAIYSPYVRRILFGMVRRNRGRRIVQLDLHNLIGVAVLGWLMTVVTTGICLGAGSVALLLWQSTELRAMAGSAKPQAHPQVLVDRAAQAAQQAEPERRLQFAIYPGTDFSSPSHFAFLMYGRGRIDSRLFNIVLVDAGTGLVTAKRALPFYLKAIALAGPLHFGNYGGLPLKVFWLASTWSALFITVNGAWLWRMRRRARVESAMALEAVR